MCEGSIHVPHRLATSKEKLIVKKVPGHGGYKGTYPETMTDKDHKLVCIRNTTTVIIKQVRFEQGLMPALVKNYAGKRNVPVTMDRHSIITFPNGMQMTTHGLLEGVRIDLGIPVKKRAPKGMTVVNRALKEAIALADTDPKPGETEPTEPGHKPPDKPGNPNPGEGKPAEHPGQGEPTPHPQPQTPEKEPA